MLQISAHVELKEHRDGNARHVQRHTPAFDGRLLHGA